MVSEPRRGEDLKQHLAAIVESSHDAIISTDPDGLIISWNEGATRLLGYQAEEVVGKSIAVLNPPDRRDEEATAPLRSDGERTEPFETIRRRKDGVLVDVSLVLSPVSGANGAVVGAAHIMRDISSRRRLAEQNSLLLNEMQHRVKNLNAVIEGLARLSQPRGEPAVEAFLTTFLGRLRALLSTGELIVSSSQREADLKRVFEVVLKPFVDPARTSPIRIDGPSLVVSEHTSGALALAAHELATNALKYGALKTPTGEVSFSWSVQPRGDRNRVRIVWKERGGDPILRAPENTGFGSRVIRAAVAREQEGKAEVVFEPDGLLCAFEFLAEASASRPRAGR